MYITRVNNLSSDRLCSDRFTRHTTELITMLLLPLSILMVGYALTVYHFRTKFLIKKQVSFLSRRICCTLGQRHKSRDLNLLAVVERASDTFLSC